MAETSISSAMAAPSPCACRFRSGGAAAGNSSSRPTAPKSPPRPSPATSTTPWSRRSPGRSAGAKCWRAASTPPFAEIAAAEKINESYVGRVLRLTLLAPDIVEAILGGRQPAGLQLDGLMRRFPVGWREQSRILRA